MSGLPGVRERKSGWLSTSPSLAPVSQLVFSFSVTAGDENAWDNEGRRAETRAGRGRAVESGARQQPPNWAAGPEVVVCTGVGGVPGAAAASRLGRHRCSGVEGLILSAAHQGRSLPHIRIKASSAATSSSRDQER